MCSLSLRKFLDVEESCPSCVDLGSRGIFPPAGLAMIGSNPCRSIQFGAGNSPDT